MGFSHISGPGIGGLIISSVSAADPGNSENLKWKAPCAGRLLHVAAHIEDGTAITCTVRNEAGDGPGLIASTAAVEATTTDTTFEKDEVLTVALSSESGSPVDLNVDLTWKSTGETDLAGS